MVIYFILNLALNVAQMFWHTAQTVRFMALSYLVALTSTSVIHLGSHLVCDAQTVGWFVAASAVEGLVKVFFIAFLARILLLLMLYLLNLLLLQLLLLLNLLLLVDTLRHFTAERLILLVNFTVKILLATQLLLIYIVLRSCLFLFLLLFTTFLVLLITAAAFIAITSFKNKSITHMSVIEVVPHV